MNKKKLAAGIIILFSILSACYSIRSFADQQNRMPGYGFSERDTGWTEAIDREEQVTVDESSFVPETAEATNGKSSIHIIDVGQGNAVLIQADGCTLLYDGGNWDTKDVLMAYLKENNVYRLDYLVVSHYDADHCAGLVPVMEQMEVGMVLEPDYVHDSNTYQKLMETQQERGIVPVHPSIGDTYALGNGTFTVVCPVDYDYPDGNNCSVGIRFSYGSISCIMTGDAEWESEAEFTEYAGIYGIELKSNIYVAGHHGSASSSSDALMDAVCPDIVAVSAGTGNRYGHPAESTMERIKRWDVELYRTDMQGTIVFTTDGNTIDSNAEPCTDFSPGKASREGRSPLLFLHIITHYQSVCPTPCTSNTRNHPKSRSAPIFSK